MLLTLLIASMAQADEGACRIVHHDTEVRWTRKARRTDRRLFSATTDHACTALPVLDLPSSSLQEVRARVVRPEAATLVFGPERLVPSAEGWHVVLPEAGRGDVVELVVKRRLEGETTSWEPRGAAAASLRVRGDASLWSAGSSTTLWWSGRAEAPARTKVVTEAPSGVVLVSSSAAPDRRGPVRPGTQPRPPSGTAVQLVPEPGGFLPGEPPAGRTIHASFWNTASTEGWHPGPTSIQDACATGPDALAQLSSTLSHSVRAPSGATVQAACAWVEDRLVVAGEHRPAGAVWRVEGPGLKVWVEPSPVDGASSPTTLRREEETEAGVHEGGRGTERLLWVLPTLDGAPVLPDRATALSRVAYAALQASLPEPALPLAYKNRVPDAAFVESLLRRVQRDVRTDSVPGRGPLRPRRLVQLKRTGWGTPWETALLLSRLLRQARLPATPIPVRPIASGPVPPSVPVGYSDAVVFVADEDASDSGWGAGYFLSPTCRVCAPGELPLELWGSQVLTTEHQQLPPAPVSAVRIEEVGTQLRVWLSPPAALGVRAGLLKVSPTERGEALPALLGLDGLTLVSQTGLETPGAAVTLVLEGAWAGSLVLGSTGPVGAQHQANGPATVTAQRPVSASADRVLVVQEGPLRWRGRLEQHPSGVHLVEELTRGPGPVGADTTRRLHQSIDAALQDLLAAGNPPALDSTPRADQDILRPEVP